VGDPVTVTITGVTTRQLISVNWLPDQTYTAVAPSAQTGTGTGLTADILTDANGTPTLQLNAPGTGYQVGDTLTFAPPSGGADPIRAIVDSVGRVTQLAGAKWTAGKSFDGVAASSTTGTGTGMTVNIAVDSNGSPLATLVSLGTGYQIGDRVFFAAPDGVGDP